MGRRIKAANEARNVPLIAPSKVGGAKGPSVAPGFVPPQKIVIPHDPVSEGVCIAAAALDATQRPALVRKLFMDHFLVREHAEAWGAIIELDRRKLEYDPQTIGSIMSSESAVTIERLIGSIPNPTANLAFHVGNVMWDRAKSNAINGPLQKLLDSLRDPTAEPTAIRGLARSLENSFDGFGDRQWVHDPQTLVREQMKDVEARCDGRAVWPYGVDGLDFYDDKFRDGEPMRRMIPGAAPGQITCVTAISGGGKSTFTAHIALGLARLGRRVLWGAWEMKGGMSLELMACISLGWSRQDLTEGYGVIRSYEGKLALQERMHDIAQHVHFLKNPFNRGGESKDSKNQNARNLDLLHGILSDEACDVFIADLWKRCLDDDDPKLEEKALVRQQMMAESLGQHHILLQQQRLKDVETRPDKRPTREGIKGSGAWIEIPDTIIGLHRPALWKKVEDDRLEAFILKQRYGIWPVGVEFRWSAEHGSIEGGRSITYDRPGEGNEVDNFTAAGAFLGQSPKKGKRR